MNEQNKAYSLVELIVAITLLTVITGYFSVILIQGYYQYAYTVQLQRAVSLADLYMNEVLATGRWDELTGRLDSSSGYVPLSQATLGPEESSRRDYDDCDDYDGFTASAPHTDPEGRLWQDGFMGFTVSIQVRFVPYGSEEPSSVPTPIKKITVTVLWGPQFKTQLATLLTDI